MSLGLYQRYFKLEFALGFFFVCSSQLYTSFMAPAKCYLCLTGIILNATYRPNGTSRALKSVLNVCHNHEVKKGIHSLQI